MSDRDLDLGQALASLGTQLAVPDVDLVDAVHEELLADPPRLDQRRRPQMWQVAAAAAVVVVLAAAWAFVPPRAAALPSGP